MRDTGAQHIFHDIEDALHDTFRSPKILPGRRVVTRRYYTPPGSQRTVQRCPVCYGRGNVPAGFYTGTVGTSLSPEQCQSCGGSGMVTV